MGDWEAACATNVEMFLCLCVSLPDNRDVHPAGHGTNVFESQSSSIVPCEDQYRWRRFLSTTRVVGSNIASTISQQNKN